MSISLNSSIRTCRFDQGWASRLESDRFLNPENVLCPRWCGTDIVGREVCPYSWNNKAPGCNSAEDRVLVENMQRPQYMEYVTLDARGITGNLYSDKAYEAQKGLKEISSRSGNFGIQMKGSVVPPCSAGQMAEINMADRNIQAKALQYGTQKYRTLSGM
jgi:hypothetical protein